MFGLGALIAEPLCHAGWDHVVSGEQVERGVFAIIGGLAIGLPVASFHWWKNKLTQEARERVIRVATYTAPFVILAFFAYMVGPFVYQRAIEPQQPVTPLATNDIRLQQVIGQHFKNEAVVLDGKWFIDCTFEKVTFVYGGGPARIQAATMKGTYALKTGAGTPTATVCLLKMLNALTPDLTNQWQGCPEAPQ
jgi:hypothetical protein